MGKNYCHSQLEQKRGAAVRGQSCARSLCKKLVAAAAAAAAAAVLSKSRFHHLLLLHLTLLCTGHSNIFNRCENNFFNHC